MTKALKQTRNGEWTVLHMEGNPKRPEAAHGGMIEFPGGNVNVTRTTNGDYWVHILLNKEGRGLFIPEATIEGMVIDARVDSINPVKHLKDVGHLNDPDTDHFAVLIKPLPWPRK